MSKVDKGATTIREKSKVNITPQTLSEGYDGLQERSKLDVNFVLLTVSAAVICALGFKMNSDSVIVGAMVVAPLLHPLICAGATSYKRRWNTVAHALATFAMGFAVATLSAIVTNLLYRTTFQSEITARLSGSAADYFLVALFSGSIGTYAVFSPKIHEAIAGIAISVALMPPTVMLGIGIAERSNSLTISSALIVTNNVLGIYAGSFVMVVCLHWMSKREIQARRAAGGT